MHSTSAMAGAFAGQLRAQRLVLTHFSGRYKTGGSSRVSEDVSEASSNTQASAALDGSLVVDPLV